MNIASRTRADIMGSMLHWSISGHHNREKLSAGLAFLGLEKFIPAERTDKAALKAALKETCCPSADYMVQARDNPEVNGLEVVHVLRSVANSYPSIGAAKVVDGVVQVIEGSFSQSPLQYAFNVAKGAVCGTTLGKSLADIARSFNAVCTRPNGGVYYLPPESISKFEALAKAVEASAEEDGKSRIDIIEFVYTERSLRMVRDTLAQEVLAEAEQMSQDFSARPNASQEYVDRRMQKADALRQKIEQYESILSEPLEKLREAIDAVSLVQGASMLASMGAPA